LVSAGTPPPPPPPGATVLEASRVSQSTRPTTLAEAYVTSTPKSRTVFVLTGIFLGVFGVHNFYAGYTKKAVWQLLLTLFTCFYGSIISWIWAIVEICTVKQDADGVDFN
jgi:TM2 domain-containing membrane protein YozV